MSGDPTPTEFAACAVVRAHGLPALAVIVTFLRALPSDVLLTRDDDWVPCAVLAEQIADDLGELSGERP